MEGLQEIKKALIVETKSDDILDEVFEDITAIRVRVQIGYKMVVAYFSKGRYNRTTLINQVITKYFPELDEEAI